MRRWYAVRQSAFDLMACHRTIARVKVGAARLHALDDRLADLHRNIAKFPLYAISSVVTGTSLDGLHGGPRNELQYVASLESDVLHAQVARHVVCDLPERAGEIHAQQSRLVAQRQVFEWIEHVLLDGQNVRVIRKHQR
jgi:hypothetical protein